MSFWSRDRLLANFGAIINDGDEARVTHSAYELCLGAESFTTNNDEPRQLDNGACVTIAPGEFALLLTSERVTIPNDAIGLLSIKFSLKQRGLINVSGFHVDPGYKGNLVFSVFNAASRSIILRNGEPMFLLWLADLSSSEPTTQAQTSRPYGNGIGNSIPTAMFTNIQSHRSGNNRISITELHDRVADLSAKVNVVLTLAGTVVVLLCLKVFFG